MCVVPGLGALQRGLGAVDGGHQSFPSFRVNDSLIVRFETERATAFFAEPSGYSRLVIAASGWNDLPPHTLGDAVTVSPRLYYAGVDPPAPRLMNGDCISPRLVRD